MGKFGLKTQNCLFELKWHLVHRLIPIYRIQWWCSIFLFYITKYHFWINLVQKTQIVSLSWNLQPKLNFCFFGNNFLGKFDEKIKIISLSWNLVARLIQIFRIQWQCSLFSNVHNVHIFDQKYPFWVNFVQKTKIVSFSWNFVPARLIRICRIQWCC